MNDLTIFDAPNLPAHITRLFGDAEKLNADLIGGIGLGFPVLSYKGKTWALVEGGERHVITNADGDPRASLELVILRANPALSKVYYKSGYVEGSAEKPDCYSHDGVAPAADAQEPQATKCGICPMNQWGSRISENGSKIKACADSKRLAVVSAHELNRPILLRIPAATLRDLAAYGEQLAKRRVPVAAVVTRVSFDPNVAHPKMVFRPVRLLTEDEAAVVAEQIDSSLVRQICGIEEGPAQEAHDSGDPQPQAAPRTAPRVVSPATRRAAATRVSEAEIDAALSASAKPAAAEEAPAQAPKPARAAKAEVAETPANGAAQPAEQPAPKPSRAEQVKTLLADADASLDAILASLDDA